MTAAAFAIVSGQFLWSHQLASFMAFLMLASIIGVFGVTMSGTGALFAVAISISEECPKTKKENLRQCREMIMQGLVGIVIFAVMFGLVLLGSWLL